MSHLGADNKFRTRNVVPEIEKVLSGKAFDEPVVDKKQVKTEKVDGRTKEYRSTVKRMADGGRRKNGEGLDARTRGYRSTVARIAARAEKQTQMEESVDVNEMFSDVDFLIDQLTNMMENLDKEEFVDIVSSEVQGVTPKTAKQMFEDYWKLSEKDREKYGISDWKDWLMGYGIRESVNELQTQSSPKYRGGASVVRGGLAMTDERLGKLRIMMRNIAKFEGVDALANEICDALDRSDGMKLAQAIIKKKKSY